jgi:hypothetical protein
MKNSRYKYLNPLLPKVTMMQQRQVRSAPSAAACRASSPPRSASIPIPRPHPRRTPSEVRREATRAQEVRRAERDDGRMYARIVAGIHSQLQRQCSQNRGLVHPLSWRSLQGVVRTMHASPEELARQGGGPNTGWEGTFVEDRSDDDEFLRWLAQMPAPPSRSMIDVSLSTRGSTKKQEEDDDDCIFSLEL